MSFFNELKRRNVLRVGAAYLVVAWLLIQVAETTFPLFGYDESPARIIVIMLAIGFFPSLIFAWAFELTPEGLKKEKEVDRSQSVTPHTGKKLDRIIMVVLALALGYFAFDKFVMSESREASVAEIARQEGRSEALIDSYGDKSIAVLAFVDLSPDGDHEYFSDGISEELLNLLAKIPGLRVISRTSAFSYKGKGLNVADIARELNVANILEGSVRKNGNQIRITVQLIEARSDTHLWSETYDRTLEDIFSVQEEVATVVANELKLTLMDDSLSILKTDPEAYALYLQGMHLFRLMTADSMQGAVVLFQKALSIDQNYLPAWLGLSRTYGNLGIIRGLTGDEARAGSRDALERASEISPDSPLVLWQLAVDYFEYEGDLTMAARHFERALQLVPTNTGLIGDISGFLSALGRMDQAILFGQYQVSRDPVNAIAYNNLGLRYRYAGQIEDAKAAFLTALTLSPSAGGVEYELGATFLLDDDYIAAASSFSREPIPFFGKIGMAMANYALGETAASDQVLNDLLENFSEDGHYYIALVMAYKHESDRAFEWLHKAKNANSIALTDVTNEPLFSHLHADSRWLPFLESIGMSADQRADINFEVVLPK